MCEGGELGGVCEGGGGMCVRVGKSVGSWEVCVRGGGS